MSKISVCELRRFAEHRLAHTPDGRPLDSIERALLSLGVAASVTSLDKDAIGRAIAAAIDAGAAPPQIQEVVSLVSALGVHSLMATSSAIAAAAQASGEPLPDELSPEQQKLWDRCVGDEPYWTEFQRQIPGFLNSLVRLSPEQFEAFFAYCSVPWKSGFVGRETKELIALACDVTPSHRFGPGFRFHLEIAIALGVGRRAILEAMDVAANAPTHSGFA
jgi:alkylhydroperoxidase/carboxymuconolactone decarboxylase family protein YurZ